MQRAIRDGVALAYDEVGSGSPPLLFIHGWCCDHTYLAPQIEHFHHAHRVVAVDLRGHGTSDAPVQAYTMAGLADDLAWLIEDLGIERPVAIGHSMGGTVALELAARYPGRVAAVVAIDASLLPTDAARRVMLDSVVPGLQGPDYQEVMRGLAERTMFLPTDDPALTRRVVRHMASAPQHVMASAAEDMFTRDAATAAAACQVPFLFITAAAPRSDLAQLRALCPQLVVGQTVGAGHFAQLLVPEQVNAMIERFLAVSAPTPTQSD